MRSELLGALACFALVLTQAGCGQPASGPGLGAGTSGGAPQSSGTSAAGGTTAKGGSTAAGGAGGTNGPGASGGAGAGGDTAASGGQASTGGNLAGGSTALGGSSKAGGTTSSGGTTASGGATANGGATVSGGASASGGNTGSGGVSAGAGATAAGGISGDGGTPPGGNTPSGGSAGSGGASASGGATAKGGTSGSGGTTATGGTQGSGGASGTGIQGSGKLATTCPDAIPAGITAEWCNCDQWGQLTKGDTTYYNDIWGSGAGPQCIWVAGSQWGTTANHPSGGSVKSYPNISVSPGKAISAYNTFTSSFQITVPSGGNWEVAYDFWVQNSSGTQVEIMLWVNYTKGSVFPAGTLSKSNVSTGGSTWDVYYGAYGGHDVVSLLRTANSTSGTVDIKAILNWIIADKGNFQSNWTLYQFQFGPEIVADSGVQSFVVSSYSVSSS